jgi:hypothetical protein
MHGLELEHLHENLLNYERIHITTYTLTGHNEELELSPVFQENKIAQGPFSGR